MTIYEKNQRRRRDDIQFDRAPNDYITTPHVYSSLGVSASSATNFVMPAGGFLAIRHSVTMSAGDVTVEAVNGNRAFTHAALSANVVNNRLGQWFEEGETIGLTRSASAIAGNFELLLITALGEEEIIATCVFT